MVLAITGVAGPEPDEDGNPVGLMHVAVARRGGSVRHERHTFGDGGREELRTRAMHAALELAARMLDEMQPAHSTQP
jgi:nicotinamide-nucleotide amidase